MKKIKSAAKDREAVAIRIDRESREIIDREQDAVHAKMARLKAKRLAKEAKEKPAASKRKPRPSEQG